MAVLRYAPRNWLVIDWPFIDCSLPAHAACEEESDEAPACAPKPVLVYPDTYDWARFLPEVMVGIENPDPDIAANYTRQAAIEFARDAHVLQRELIVELEPGRGDYSLPHFPDERIAGVLEIQYNDDCDTSCSTCGLSGHSRLGFTWNFDTSRHLLRLHRQPGKGLLTIRVWAVPTEDACRYDRFLYDSFRAAITVGARRYYVMANHFRDRALMQTLAPPNYWDREILAALRQAHRVPSARTTQPGSGVWEGGRGAPRYGNRRYR